MRGNNTYIFCNPIALRSAKTLWSFGHSECNRVTLENYGLSLKEYHGTSDLLVI